MSTSNGCVALALSTFRQSQKAVCTAILEARCTKKLIIVYVVDVNLSRYLIGPEYDYAIRDLCETDLLLQYQREGRFLVEEIAAQARRENIEAESLVQIGRFAYVCLGLIQRVKPSVVVTTRSKRPDWVKRLYAAPVDEIIEKAGCPVVVL